MTWYKDGSVNVTNGSPAVTGIGTSWRQQVKQGDAFYGPDRLAYEVLSVASDTSITLAEPYAGTTTTSAPYRIAPTQGFVRGLTAAVQDLIADSDLSARPPASLPMMESDLLPIDQAGVPARATLAELRPQVLRLAPLPAASLPVSGADTLLLSQDGVAKRVSASSLGLAAARPSLHNVVAMLGDSITADGINNTVNETRNANRGLTHWVPFLTSQRFTSPQSVNFGVSGENSAQIAARVGQVIDSGAGVCIVLAGTNDIGGFTTAQTKANLTTIYRSLSDAGVLIIALPILPRSLTPESQYSFPQLINEWIRDQAAVYDKFVFIQPYEFWDQYSTTYSPRAGYTYDGLHPMAIGAFTIARPIAEYLNSIRPYPGIAVHSICDFFNSTNQRGVLNPNPLLGGTGGTKGAGVTGDVADSHRVQAFANGGSIGSLTVTCSKGASTRSGGVNQRIIVGGTATGGFDTSVILDVPSGLTNIAPGDTIEMLADIEIAGATIGISGIEAYVAVQQGGVFKWARDGFTIVSDDYVWRDIPEARFRTPPLALSGVLGASFFGIKIYLKNTGTTRSCDLRVNNIAVRKIVD